MVYKAGSTLIEKQKFARQAHHSQARDVKIKGDFLSEAIILESLQLNSSFPILSEEAGIIGKIDRKEYLWIVDPLDGSLNYSHGIPLFCISVALWKGNEPILVAMAGGYARRNIKSYLFHDLWWSI